MAASLYSIVDEFCLTLIDTLVGVTELAGVQIETGWPGEQRQPELVWLESVQFTATNPVMTGQPSETVPLTREALATIPLQIEVLTVGQTLDQARTRVCEISAAIDNTLAADPTLAGIDGLFAATQTLGVVDVTRSNAGVIGYGRYVLQVHIRASEAP